jgi:hypothetical protein
MRTEQIISSTIACDFYWEVLGSNLGPDAVVTHLCNNFPQYLQADSIIVG